MALGANFGAASRRTPNYTDVIAEAMARAMFVSAWADEQESKGPRFAPGTDVMDVAPATPSRVLYRAHNLIGRFELKNKMPMVSLLYQAAKADGIDPYAVTLEDQYVRKFGHYLAMEAIGHGVSWFDDHAKFKIEFPYFEYNLGD